MMFTAYFFFSRSGKKNRQEEILTTDKEKFLKSVCIICDSREQKNEHIISQLDRLGINHITQKLPYGDYSFKIAEYDFTLLYTIERKANIDELWKNCTTDRERFEAEIHRMSAISHAATLIVENCKDRGYLRGYCLSDKQMAAQNRKVREVGKIIDGTLQSWASPNRYGLQIFYNEVQSQTAPLLLSLFYYYYKNFQELIKPLKRKKKESKNG